MAEQMRKKYIHVGRYVAEVEVVLTEDETQWSPYLSLEQAYMLDDVRAALRRGDLEAAACYGSIYEMQPVAQQSG